MEGGDRQECVDRMFRSALALVCLTLVVGCGGSPYDSVVSGTVSLDGVPIGPGIVQFVPVGRSRNPATGAIQVDGGYVLKTSNALGLQPGQYDVTVAIYDQPELDPGERAAPGSAPLRIPVKYSSLETTDLEYTVDSGNNEIDISLVTEDETKGL